jgi:hypothetical protein
VIQLEQIVVRAGETHDVIWTADTPGALRDLNIFGSCVLLPSEDTCVLVSYGTDPQLQLPAVESSVKPLRVEIRLRVDKANGAIYEALDFYIRAVKENLERSRTELRTSHAERVLIAAELKRVGTERNEARRELMRATETIESSQLRELECGRSQERLKTDLATLRLQLQNYVEGENAARGSLETLQNELVSLRGSLAEERQIRAGLEHSASWRITMPARALMRLLRAALRR